MANDAINPTLARVANQPVLFAEGFEQQLTAALLRVDDFLSSDQLAGQHHGDRDFWDFEGRSWMARYRPYQVHNGILIVPVKGSLLNDFPYQFGTIATGYEYIQEAMKRGVNDDAVKGIAMVIDSPGGLVAGNFELVEKIFQMRGSKPIHAFANHHAYSAAYNIAAAADHITMSRTGGVGSIGVVMVHVEASDAYKEMGFGITIIRSKERKMEGNRFEKLSDQARERFQAETDRLDRDFVALVARNRGISEESVHATNALTFSHEEAISEGLADAVGAFEDAFTAFTAQITSTEGSTTMADKNEAETVLKTAHDSAVAAAKTEGVTEGAAQERARISGILALEEAATRPAATQLLIELGVSAEDAKGKLAKLPEEKAVAAAPAEEGTDDKPKGAGAPAGMFEAAMTNTPNPNLGAGVEGGEGDDKENRADGIRALVSSAGIAGYRKPKSA